MRLPVFGPPSAFPLTELFQQLSLSILKGFWIFSQCQFNGGDEMTIIPFWGNHLCGTCKAFSLFNLILANRRRLLQAFLLLLDSGNGGTLTCYDFCLFLF